MALRKAEKIKRNQKESKEGRMESKGTKKEIPGRPDPKIWTLEEDLGRRQAWMRKRSRTRTPATSFMTSSTNTAESRLL